MGQPPDRPPAPVAGWYPDPSGSGQQRWWDGSAWGAVQPSAPPPSTHPSAPPPSSGAARKPTRVGVWVGAAVVVVFVLMGIAVAGVDTGAQDRAGAACGNQWELAADEARTGGGADVELRATFSRCPNYREWNNAAGRAGQRGDDWLRAGCAVVPDSTVCRDARQVGALAP